MIIPILIIQSKLPLKNYQNIIDILNSNYIFLLPLIVLGLFYLSYILSVRAYIVKDL